MSGKIIQEFFKTTEKYAAEELIDAKPVLPGRLIAATGLDQYDSAKELLKAKPAFYNAVYRFAVTAVIFAWMSWITWTEQRKNCVLRADTMIFLRYATGHM